MSSVMVFAASQFKLASVRTSWKTVSIHHSITLSTSELHWMRVKVPGKKTESLTGKPPRGESRGRCTIDVPKTFWLTFRLSHILHAIISTWQYTIMLYCIVSIVSTHYTQIWIKTGQATNKHLAVPGSSADHSVGSCLHVYLPHM